MHIKFLISLTITIKTVHIKTFCAFYNQVNDQFENVHSSTYGSAHLEWETQGVH